MKSVLEIVIAIAIGLLSNSCSNQELRESKTVIEVGDKKWSIVEKIQHIDDYSFTASLIPSEYFIEKNGTGSKPGFDINKEKVIAFHFEHDDAIDLLVQEYTKRSYQSSVEYMSFGIKQDFKVKLSSGRIINCTGVLFERNFKVAPFKRVLLFFQDDSILENEKLQLIYNDNLFGNGIVKFSLDSYPVLL